MLSALCLVLAVSVDFERPVRVEIIKPLRQESFNRFGKARRKTLSPSPVTRDGVLTFEGANDGDRQVDPQIAVGGGYVLQGTNSGLYIFDTAGRFVDAVPQSEFNNGIDPKLFFDPHNRVFGFDLWVYWDKEKVKPVNISVSETSDPRGAWNTYPVPAPQGVDGGAIGYSRKWIGYSFPGGPEETFVLRSEDARKGRPARVWHFAGSLGHPVATQDRTDDLRFVHLTDTEIIIRTVGDDGSGAPVVKRVVRAQHSINPFAWPPASPQQGTDKSVASGDRNPKNIVQQGNHLWFSQTIGIQGRAAVRWNQVTLDGKWVQTGTFSHDRRSYIQTSIAVNKRRDVLLGFQETGPDMFVSARYALRKSKDALGTMASIQPLWEGKAATAGGPWGDYSGSVVDGDNLTDLWTVQSFANASGKGSTVIARVRP